MSVAPKREKFGIKTFILDWNELLNTCHQTKVVSHNIICSVADFTIKALFARASRGAGPSCTIRIASLTDICIPYLHLGYCENFSNAWSSTNWSVAVPQMKVENPIRLKAEDDAFWLLPHSTAKTTHRRNTVREWTAATKVSLEMGDIVNQSKKLDATSRTSWTLTNSLHWKNWVERSSNNSSHRGTTTAWRWDPHLACYNQELPSESFQRFWKKCLTYAWVISTQPIEFNWLLCATTWVLQFTYPCECGSFAAARCPLNSQNKFRIDNTFTFSIFRTVLAYGDSKKQRHMHVQTDWQRFAKCTITVHVSDNLSMPASLALRKFCTTHNIS